MCGGHHDPRKFDRICYNGNCCITGRIQNAIMLGIHSLCHCYICSRTTWTFGIKVDRNSSFELAVGEGKKLEINSWKAFMVLSWTKTCLNFTLSFCSYFTPVPSELLKWVLSKCVAKPVKLLCFYAHTHCCCSHTLIIIQLTVFLCDWNMMRIR